jgi:hypothetical protein
LQDGEIKENVSNLEFENCTWKVYESGFDADALQSCSIHALQVYSFLSMVHCYKKALPRNLYVIGTNPRFRMRNKMSRIHNTVFPMPEKALHHTVVFQYDVLSDACSTLAHAGKIVRFLERDLLHSPIPEKLSGA